MVSFEVCSCWNIFLKCRCGGSSGENVFRRILLSATVFFIPTHQILTWSSNNIDNPRIGLSSDHWSIYHWICRIRQNLLCRFFKVSRPWRLIRKRLLSLYSIKVATSQKMWLYVNQLNYRCAILHNLFYVAISNGILCAIRCTYKNEAADKLQNFRMWWWTMNLFIFTSV